MQSLVMWSCVVEGDLDLNSQVLTWPQRINPVFDQNEELIESSKVSGEKSMLERKEKVISVAHTRLHSVRVELSRIWSIR